MKQLQDSYYLFIARFFSLTGGQILFFAIPILIYTLTHSAFYSGIAFSLEWIARLISFPVSGFNTDYFGSKQVYIIADLSIGVFCLAALILIKHFSKGEVVILMILAMSAGFLCEQNYVSTESLAPNMVAAHQYPKMQSILSALDQVALLLGPSMGGLLIIYFKLEDLIGFTVILFVISGFTMMQITLQPHSIKQSPALSHTKNMLTGLKVVFSDSYLANLVILSMLYNFLFGLITSSAPIMAVGIFNQTPHFYAVMNILAGIFSIGAIVILNYSIRRFSLVITGLLTFILSALLCLLFTFLNSVWVYLFIYILFYCADGVFAVFFRSERLRVIPKSVLGRTIGATILMTFILFPLSGGLISLSQHYWQLQNMLSVVGGLVLIIGVPLCIKLYKQNQRNNYQSKEHA